MEEIKFENNLVTFEHFENEIENIRPIDLYYSKHLLDDNLQVNKRIIYRSKIKISSKTLDNIFSKSIYLIGCLMESNSEYLPIHYLIIDKFLIITFETIILAIEPKSLKIKWTMNDFSDIIDFKESKGDIFIYDELEVSRIEINGNVKWRYSGSDHFISYLGTENFKFYDNYIQMVDSNEVVYKISYNGEDLENINKNYFPSKN